LTDYCLTNYWLTVLDDLFPILLFYTRYQRLVTTATLMSGPWSKASELGTT